MPEGAVDLLEPVHPEQQQPGPGPYPDIGAQRLPTPVGEQRAVRQPGQGVVKRVVHRAGPFGIEQPAVPKGD